eukprot:TRINITY_DN58638_c1_g1_i4.p1 TRINITY_DN58638_c1_g1~~TRINITY_DN58638_c1_g1_i4.p1  ORF type:complete len:406 (+),score=101.62 TRINITY_DN58638_c1_g1_i4:124-1341(+)
MERHPSDPQVVRWTCNVLHLVVAESADLAETAADDVISSGGLAAAWQSLVRFVEQADVQKWSLAAIAATVEQKGDVALEKIAAASDANQPQLLECVMRSMQTNANSPSVQEHALTLLGTACLDGAGSEMAHLIVDHGVSMTLTPMGAYQGHVGIQRRGAAALWALADKGGSYAVEEMVAAGALEALVLAWRTHSADASLQRWVSAALWVISEQGTDKELLAILDSGCLDVLKEALEAAAVSKDSDHAVDLSERCLGALVTVAGRIESASTAMALAGVLSAVIQVRDALEEHDEVEQLASLIVELIECERQAETEEVERELAADAAAEEARGPEGGDENDGPAADAAQSDVDSVSTADTQALAREDTAPPPHPPPAAEGLEAATEDPRPPAASQFLNLDEVEDVDL